ncbi:MAG: type II secretion system F family protein [Ignavibacteriales bacterium]|nr:MAG: type II secretion system F family protein [Ignavibacteriales bacterium]
MFKKIPHKEIVDFTRVLSLLLYSRVSIIQAFELIHKQTKNEKLKGIIKSILKDIKSGSSLSKSFAKYPNVFADIFIANLKVGEETGEIAEVIGEYSLFLQKMQSLKGKILQAIRYPVMVLVVALGVVIFMLVFIIPTFETLFQSVNAELPGITQFLLILSRGLVGNSTLLFFILITSAIVIYFGSKSDSFQKNIVDKTLVKLPVVSKMYVTNLLARFSLSMAILLKSRVGLVESLKISKNITSNHLFRNQIDHLLKKTIKGETLSSNVKASLFFDPTFTRLLAAGEESAELDKVFLQMSNYYSNEFDHYLDNVTSLLEPALILIVGGIVAVILIGLYLPMFEIINYFGV